MNNFNWDNHFKNNLGNKYPDETIIRYTLKKFKNKKILNKKVLDICCGLGNNLYFFTEKGFNVYACGYFKEAIYKISY